MQVLAQSWSDLLVADASMLNQITLDLFDDTLADEPVTRANVPRAVVRGCQRKLLFDREGALRALRDGFTLRGKVDLSVQLAQHRNSDLALLLQGKATISCAELRECFNWAHSASSHAVGYLYDVLGDETAFDESQRLLMLRWCTGLNALPVSGVTRKVVIRLAEVVGSVDGPLPVVHTCSHEIDLPPYSSKEVLLTKLTDALTDYVHDPSFGQQ